MKVSAALPPPVPGSGRHRPGPAGLLFLPVNDFLSGMEHCLRETPRANAGILLLCFLFSWWVYVPVHELLHVLGCILSGGSVSRLELSPVYGAAFLQRFFPFISAGSDYAGQLKGFDTAGSDITYLVTVILPYSLTIFPGIPLLRSVSAMTTSPRSGCIRFGLASPLAYAPFMAITGDYYEISSILLSRLTAELVPGFRPFYWRSDDMLRLARELIVSGPAPDPRDIAGLAASFVLALLLAFGTYAAGSLCAGLLLKSTVLRSPRP